MRTLHKYLLSILLLFTTAFGEKVTLQLDWLHQFQFAGYYVAKEKGFYAERDLDVTINQFDFNVNLLNEVLHKDASYAVGKSSLLIDKMAGIDVVALAAIYQHSPMVLLTRKDSNIKYPKDLYKKKVMLTPDARMAIAINSMISSQGLKLSDVNFEPHSFKLDDLINKKTDAMGCYLSNEPYILKEKGVKFNVLNPQDYGFDFYGGILFTSQKELDENPARARDFYEASMLGWKYAFENIEETAQLIFNKYNTQKKSLASLIYEGEVLKDLADFDEGKLGNLSKKKYSEILKIYSLLGYEHNNDILNDFIYNPNEIVLTKKEKEYLANKTILYKPSNIEPFNISSNKGIEYKYLDLIKTILPADIKVSQDNNYDFKLNINNDDVSKTTLAINSYNFAIITKSNINFIQSLDNLSGKKVAIIDNYFFTEKYKEHFKDINYLNVSSMEQAFALLSEGDVFAIIASMPIAIDKLTAKYQNFKISGFSQFKHDIHFEVNPNNLLLQSILNKAIAKIEANEINQVDKVYLATKRFEESVEENSLSKFVIPTVIIIIILLFFIRKLANEAKKRKALESDVQAISNTDDLTNIYNRKMSINMLNNAMAISKRYDRPLCVIFFDIDDFKDINENYSYKIGDGVIQELSSLISSNIRTTDIFGRWEGEEFILILPETSQEQAQTTAEHLKEIIYNYDFDQLKTYITCSFSVVEYIKNENVDSIVKRGSVTLRELKKESKNSVRVG